MTHKQDDTRLEESIRRALGAEDARFDADGWMKKHARDIEALRSRTHRAAAGSPRWRTWRTIMHARTTKIIASAVAAGLVLAVVLLLVNLLSRGKIKVFD